MKIDPYKHKERYFNWKEKTKKGIPEISKINSEVIKQFLSDMEIGMNIGTGSKKGARIYIRVNTLRGRLIFLANQFKQRIKLDNMTEIIEEQICVFFNQMRNGENLEEIKERGRKFFDNLKKEYSESDGTILVVSHGAFLKVFIGSLLGMNIYDSIFKLFIEHYSMTELEINDKHKKGYRFNFINDISHLNV